MSRLRAVLTAFILFLFISPSAAIAGSINGSITVSAAASLKNVLTGLATDFEHQNSNTKILLNFGSSGALMAQIEEGAPVDVFIAASTREVDELGNKGLIYPGSVFDMAGNSVVLVTPANMANVHSFSDLARPDVKRIAVGNPKTVPAGRYAEEVLKKLGLFDSIKGKFIYTEDVRQALDYTKRGEVDAAVVYGTDAAIDGQAVRIAALAPANSHKPVVYPAAIIKGSRNMDLASAFSAFLRSARARAVLKRYGFVLEAARKGK